MRTLIMCFMATLIWSKETVDVTVDRRRINEGDSITLTVTAKNLQNDPDVSLPIMQDFKIVNGPNQSSSTNVQFMNGKMTKSSTTTITWTMIPIRTGQIIIPAIKIQAGKTSFSSSPISITVSKRGNHQSVMQPQFFIEAELDKDAPYRGEQVIITYILFTQVDVSSFDDELPKYQGFWTEELFAAKKLQLIKVQKNGSQYHAATIKKLALFPIQSGEIIIEPMTAVIGIPEKQQRYNFSLFGPPSKKYPISTNQLKFKVKPLPDRKNGEVSAVIGNWNIRSGISSKEVKQDEAITFQIIINGTGNIQAVDISNISFPNELEVFEPETQTKENPLRDQIGGEKKFEWVLIPRFAGDIYIPQIQFDYFDPKEAKWMTKSTTRHRLKVSPNEKASSSSFGLSKEEVALVGKDIRFIDESHPKWRDRNSGLVNGTTLSFLLLSGVIFAFPLAHNINRRRMEQSLDRWQARRALKTAFTILDSPSDTPKEIYTHIYKAVISFINQKTGSNRVEYSTGEIIEIIKNYDETKVYKEIEQILIRGEAARFASIATKEAQYDIMKIKKLLEKIDGNWS